MPKRLTLFPLCFTALAFAALIVAPSVRAAQWLATTLWVNYVVTFLIFLACVIGGQRVLQQRLPQHDPLLYPLVMFLAGWGLVEVWRLAPAFGLRQGAWLAVSVCALIAIIYTPDDLRWLRRYRYLWISGALGLTMLTLIAGVNPSGGNQQLWLGCCGLYFQPSEALKLLFVLYLASYLAENQNVMMPNSPRTNATIFAPTLLIWGFSLVLLLTQRDLGTGSLLFASFIAMLYLATNQKRFLIVGGLLLLAGGAVSYALFDVVQLRVEAWLNPFRDPSGRSFQIVQSLIALANGGAFGRGVGVGAPTVIPVVHSDFVYAAIVEEWGLLGGVAVIAVLAIILMRGLRTAALANTTYRTLLAGGLSILLGLQTILIIGGVTKALPLTGVTLPFLSYGGSSMLINFIIIGLLLKLSNER